MRKLAKPSIQIQQSFLDLFQLGKQGEYVLNKEKELVGEIHQEKGLSMLDFSLGRFQVSAYSEKEMGAYQMAFSMEDKKHLHTIYGTFYNSRTTPLRTGLSYIRFCDGIYSSSVEMNREQNLLRLEQSDNSIEVVQNGPKLLEISHILHRQPFLEAEVDMSGRDVVIHLQMGNNIRGKWFEQGGMPFLREKLFRLDKAFYWMILKEQSPFWDGDSNFFWNAVDSCYDSKQDEFHNLIFNQEEMIEEVQKEKGLQKRNL